MSLLLIAYTLSVQLLFHSPKINRCDGLVTGTTHWRHVFKQECFQFTAISITLRQSYVFSSGAKAVVTHAHMNIHTRTLC